MKTHVGRILMKLGVRDRVQLVILAHEHGLAGARRLSLARLAPCSLQPIGGPGKRPAG